MSSQAGLIPSFVAAIQASLSVLLVISYGGIAAHFKFLNPVTSKSISKICVQMFLPALLLVQIGSELHAGSARRYVVIFIWALICHFVSFLIGIAAHLWLDMPDWITAALMFNNTTSYPLLLIQSLDGTGILDSLIVTDETTRAAIERAKSYFLVFATVSSCLTFAIGPRLIAWEHAPDTPTDSESDKEDSDIEDEEAGPVNGSNNGNRRRYSSEEPCSPTDRTQLLIPDFPRSSISASDRRLSTVKFFPSRRPSNFSNAIIYNNRRPSVIPRKKWLEYHETTRWWLLFLWDFLNAPLLGAVVGVVIGLIPSLHTAFFSPSNDGGIFTAWLTASLKNIGSLFVPLPVVVAGVSLYFSTQRASSSTESKTPWLTTVFVLVIRFVVWPVVSIASIYLLAKDSTILGSDPMLWFTMMLMPTGPPAMKLITMVEVSDADEEDEHKIAKLLTVSYIISPILAFTVVGSLRTSVALIGS